MEIAWLLNIAGLLISAYGAFLMCSFPMEAPTFDAAGRRIISEGPTDIEARLDYERYRFWSRSALYFLVIGFVFQLAGTVLAFMMRFWI